MDIPFFYHEAVFEINQEIVLPTDTSKHCVVVLRMREGAHLYLTNGKGDLALVQMTIPDKYKARVHVQQLSHDIPRKEKLILAIGFTRNKNRNEWLLEKAVEIGVDAIIPLQCYNSERDKFNIERAQSVMIAALIQSQQVFLPKMYSPMKPAEAVRLFQQDYEGALLIAHCEEEKKHTLWEQMPNSNVMILIGPEGDFAKEEIDVAIDAGAVSVSLGPNRLRTETAAIYACTVFNQKNYAI